jgi:hypothetical protein
MIIGINGRIGSGKDTVGKIIQYLTDDTVSKTVYPKFEEFDKLDVGNEGYHPWQIKKFAGKLKQIASLLTGIPVEMWEDQEFKKQEMPKCWNKLQQSGRSKVSIPMTYRDFLQKLGTEAMRDGLHTNVWVNALFADYRPVCDKFESKMLQTGGNYTSSICSDCDCFPKWIITDMRFPNEMDAVKERKGITIKVVRPVLNQTAYEKAYEETHAHPSETALDNAKFDYEIINDGTIEDLIEKVKEILIKENINGIH